MTDPAAPAPASIVPIVPLAPRDLKLEDIARELDRVNAQLAVVNEALRVLLTDRNKFAPMMEAARVQFFPDGKFKRPSLFGG